MPLPNGPSTWPTRRIVNLVLFGNSAWRKAVKGDRARRVSAVRRLLPPPAPVPVEHKPVLLGPIRWVDVAGRALRRRWMTRLSQAIRRDPSACGHAAQPFLAPSPTPCAAVASSLEVAGPTRMQCLVGTTEASHHGGFRSRMPRQQLTQEELAHQEAFSIIGHLPSEPLMRTKNPCLLLAVSFLYFIACLLTTRCASRGKSDLIGHLPPMFAQQAQRVSNNSGKVPKRAFTLVTQAASEGQTKRFKSEINLFSFSRSEL